MKKWYLVALSGLFLTAGAHADLVIKNGNKKPKPNASAHPLLAHSKNQPTHPLEFARLKSVPQVGHIINVGHPSDGELLKNSPIQGWGQAVPLKDALRQILPAGFNVEPSPGFNWDKSVSWEGGQDWTNILGRMARIYQFNVTINWDRHQISFSDLPPPEAQSLAQVQKTYELSPIQKPKPLMTSKKMPSKTSSPAADKVSKSSQVSVAQVKPQPKPVEKTWILDPNKTLKQNVMDWGKKSKKWTVSWNAVDYPVVARVVLHGDLDSKNGPIATIVEAYKKANQPITAHLTLEDHVIDIENQNYNPSQVKPLNQDAAAENLLNSERYPATPDNSKSAPSVPNQASKNFNH